jgi:nitrate/nitrite-specific signal transduction histidine kinase
MRFSDDGRGFDPSRVAREHLGLDIMRERAEDIGATLSIETHLGGGTQVTVVWSQPPAGTNQLPGNKFARADVDQYVVGGWYD